MLDTSTQRSNLGVVKFHQLTQLGGVRALRRLMLLLRIIEVVQQHFDKRVVALHVVLCNANETRVSHRKGAQATAPARTVALSQQLNLLAQLRDLLDAHVRAVHVSQLQLVDARVLHLLLLEFLDGWHGEHSVVKQQAQWQRQTFNRTRCASASLAIFSYSSGHPSVPQ